MATVMPEILYTAKEEGHVMSDKVSQLASSVYSEFEKMMKKYDENVVKELMPLVVGILESLDLAYLEKQEVDVELELIKEDNEQLLTQYEREKQLRKASDQKYLEMEDEMLDYKKQTEEKIESLDSIVRMQELKNKNATDHLSRMEDKESELKKEYNKVHERYTELMRTHMDYMERAKLLMGPDRMMELANSPRSSLDRGSRKESYSYYPRSQQYSPASPFRLGGFQLPILKSVNTTNFTSGGNFRSAGSPPNSNESDSMFLRNGKDSNLNIKSELGEQDMPNINSNTSRQVVLTTETSDKEQNTEKVDVREFATATKTAEQNSLPETNLVSIPEKKISTGHEIDLDKETNDTAENLENKHVLSERSESVQIDLNLPNNYEKQMINAPLSNGSTLERYEDFHKHIAESVSQEHFETALSVENKQVKVSERSTDISKKIVPKEIKKKIKLEKERVNDSKNEPDSPISPVFESSDFSFEDIMPGLDQTITRIVATTPELEEMDESMESSNSTNRAPKRNDASIYDELDIQDLGDVDYGADITGKAVNPTDYASSDSDDEKDERNSTGMARELENLILENTELLATKNALNIVKDDLIAKVDEFSSEQEILKEEIISLKAVKDKLQSRIQSLEEELKKTKEELENKTQQAQEAENEDDVPMAQRKRFTRVEMARVLMERNQYKERLMELQEAVRWTEMIRATREHPEISQSKKKSSMWNFFSNLFSSSNKPTKKPSPIAMMKYNAPTTNMQPADETNQKSRKYNLGDKSKAFEFLQDDLDRSLGEPVVPQPDTSEKAKKERENERKEQYKQVRAHVKKKNGRMQAYGWSLPAKFQPQMPSASQAKCSIPVPVPVYCKPLFDGEPGIKILCATGINLTGSRTKDVSCGVGANVSQSNTMEIEGKKNPDDAEGIQLGQESTDHDYNIEQCDKEHQSSLVWICMNVTSRNYVLVIDANNPSEILETFQVSSTPIMCIASVPGALESDYPVDKDTLKAESYPQCPEPIPDTSTEDSKDVIEESKFGEISFVQCANGATERDGEPVSPVESSTKPRDVSPIRSSMISAVADRLPKQEDDSSSYSDSSINLNEKRLSVESTIMSLDKRASLESIFQRISQSSVQYFDPETNEPIVLKPRGSSMSSGNSTPDSSHHLLSNPSEMVRDGMNGLASRCDIQDKKVEKMSSVLPTVWIGAHMGSLYIHSSVSQWKRCLHSVKLRESIVQIVHVKGRVLVSLADGSVAIFHREADGQWDVQNYHLLDLGRLHNSIRCMSVIANRHVWCGYRNKIHVVDPQSMSVTETFDAHPRKESQVRQLAWVGDGVWVSIRLDSTLRLYHAYTHLHLQDVDIEPYVSKMLGTGKLGFSLVRITSMLISCNRLWIGTGNGVIISVPLSEGNKQPVSMGSSGGRPGGLVRVYSSSNADGMTASNFIPYCSMAQAQLSFHGHRDAVKFFVAVPGKKRMGTSTMPANEDNSQCGEPDTDDGSRLVVSGGEGYVDFRIGDGDDEAVTGETEDKPEKSTPSKGDKSHLIMWQVSCPK